MNPSDARRRILLIEDRRTGGLPDAAILAQAGYVVDALDGLEACAAAAQHPYALILMALGAADLDGVIEAARRIRRLPYPRGDVPILVLTGTLGETDRERCRAVGMDGFLTRSGEQEALLEAVAHWVEAADDPTWGLDARPGVTAPLLNRRTLAQLEEDLGAELLPEVLSTFLTETARRLGLLEARVGAGDAAGAADEAHALKGSAGTFGAMALRQAVDEMERSGRGGDAARLTALLPEVRRLVTTTCALLAAEYSSVVADTPRP
ncbi:Hpt domain-containing protein [uncultured Thiodictyon sp.]|jgi:CheY-like chemotaxis protein/HPt (histidine-containing phosphotransfer) domain-containing protein|uniref:Hpt domain-containing response regulator n=1 Tax=uncultured Thiodictyon sp. TaxID=1846217 RepID=UPI0025F9D4C8|nr:Hpt domain-containing protein [uncultured Thiodictyon sp.]